MLLIVFFPAFSFQSTLPHGSDIVSTERLCSNLYFNPRSLTGATREFCRTADDKKDFNPRSLTGATASALSANYNLGISIHAPLRERRLTHLSYTSLDDFNPRSLTGATLDSSFIYRTAGAISIHAPLRERRLSSSGRYKNVNFNPRSLTGATQKFATLPTLSDISIHAPLRERPLAQAQKMSELVFQSTLPYGSDGCMGRRSTA